MQVMDAVGALGGPEAASIHTGALKLMSSGREVIPAMGPSWAACVNLRIFLSRLAYVDAELARQLQVCGYCRVTLEFLLHVRCRTNRT